MARPLRFIPGVDTSASPGSPRPRIAVLGGGISGLGSAFWLTELLPGARIVLYEASDRLGGLIRSHREDPYLLEGGPLAFPSAAPATGALIRQAGLAGECAPARPTASGGGTGLWNGRRIIPVPKGPADLLHPDLLAPRDLFRLIAEPFIAKGSEAPDVSILDFFRRRTGEGFFAGLIEPMAAGILAGDPAVLSMAANLPRFYAMEQENGSLAKGLWKQRFRRRAKPAKAAPGTSAATTEKGCAGLVDALADRLIRRGVELRVSRPIRGVRRYPDGYLIRSFGGQPAEEGFDAVVSTLPSHALARLEADWPQGVPEFLESIPHAPVALVYLAYPGAALPEDIPCDSILPQPRAGEDILSCFLPSRMAAGRCPGDQHLLRFLLGGARKPYLAGLDDAQAVNLAARAARKLLGFSGEPSFTRVIRHPACLPQLLVGHLQALSRCRKTLRREWPGFFLAGTSCQGAGIENAVASGRFAASETADYIAGRSASGLSDPPAVTSTFDFTGEGRPAQAVRREAP